MKVGGIEFLLESVKLFLVISGVLSYEIKNKFVMCLNLIIAFIVFSMQELLSVDMGKLDIYKIGITAMIIISFNLKEKKNSLCVLGAYMFICFIDMIIAEVVMLKVGVTVDVLCNNVVLMRICDLISILLWLLVTYVIRIKGKIRSVFTDLPIRYIFLMIITLISMGMYLAPLLLIGFSDNLLNKKKIITLAATVCCIVLIITSMTLFIRNNEKKQLIKMNFMNKQLIKIQESYYQKLLTKDKEMYEFRHDISKHLYCIGILGKNKQYKELDDYIKDINVKFKELSIGIKTGNDLVNAIVTKIISDYRDVLVEWKGIIPDKVTINDVDLCTIFFNILDNAAYAVNKVKGKRKISVWIGRLNTSIVVVIENPVIEDISIDENIILTDKQDRKNHGLGTKNIEKCLKSYGGSIKYSCQSKVFRTEILIPNIIVSE